MFIAIAIILILIVTPSMLDVCDSGKIIAYILGLLLGAMVMALLTLESFQNESIEMKVKAYMQKEVGK